ncbi:MAG: hypothetical protein ABIV51_05410, partial [Saprospiraceae bacterium]
MPYHTSYYVTQSASHLYFTAEFSLLKLDKTDLSETYLTKVEGLSDVDVALAKYNPYADQLLVAYSNSNVDLVTENDVINFSEIFKNTAILGDKRINTIYFENDSWAYLACGFGLVQLNIKNEEFGFTTFTDTKVFDVAVFQDSIYMTTENGIYRISRSHANPAYFANWTKIGAESGLPDEYSANSLCQFGASLTAAIDGNLYKKQNGGNFELVAQKSGYQVQYISAEGPHLLVGWKCNGDCNGSLQVWDQSTMLNEFNNDCIRRPIYGVEDQSGRIWFADEFFPFKYIDYPSGECHSKDFNTPFSHFATDMVVDPVNNDLYIASGGIQSNGIYQFRSDGFFRYSNGQWTNFNHYFTPELADPIFYDYNALAIDPKTNHLFIGTYWGGVLEYDHSHFTVYNKDNSSLQGAVGDAQRERVSGLAFDSKGNLWVSNFAAPRPISVRKSDGSWQSFKPVTQTNLFQVVVDQQDNKWFIVQGNSGGVMVFNEGADFNSTADDKVRFINTGNSVLTSNTINCLAVDLDGAVWVGTDAGPFVFECGSNVFDSS